MATITYSNPVDRKQKSFSTIAAATTLTAANSGTVYTLPAATAGAAITLPALKSGLNFKFIVAGAFATTNWTIVSSTNVIFGSAVVNSVIVPAASENTISFVASAETIGDFVSVECDGTNWYVSGLGTLSGSVTFTAA